jgi:hypothetical protein
MGGDRIELEYTTWGSYGQYVRTLAVLVDGQVLDPSRENIRGKGVTVKRKIAVNGKEYEIELYANDSNKNAHRYIYVPREIVLAVIYDRKSSSGWKGFQVDGPGEVVAEDQTQEQVNGRYKYIKTVRVFYYRHGNIKVKLKEEELDFKKELIGKPRVIVRRVGQLVVVTGDTYHVKEQLKALGFKFDPSDKTWVSTASDSLINEVRERLEQVAEVVVQ